MNLETNLFDLDRFRGWPAAEGGGSYLVGHPAVADDLVTGGPFYESLVPRMTFSGGRLASMSLHPIELSVAAPAGSRGTPRLAEGELAVTILERFARLCEPFGLEFSVDGGIGRWQTGTQ